MIPSTKIKKAAFAAALLTASALPAYAHIGVHAGNGAASSFATGFLHPLSGLDHMMVMIAVGLWAALKGGRAIWVWPTTFVGVMLMGGALGMLHVPIPLVEPGILASVVTLGILVALAVDLPVSVGVVVIGLFAVLHGHAHGTEVSENAAGLAYMAGFAIATAMLHGIGIAGGLGFGLKLRSFARAAGAACVVVGAGLAFGVI